MWIDTHVHLDAPEFDPDRAAVREAARAAGVTTCVYPAVHMHNFEVVRALAHTFGDVYALGIHPLFTPAAGLQDLQALQTSLDTHQGDARLVAVGEIGLDFFVPGLIQPLAKVHQIELFKQQLMLAQKHNLPVIVHSRKAVDAVIDQLKRHHTLGGIAHAFNGSLVQAKRLLDLGFKLGFGGAMTYPRALHLRRLVENLPLEAFVLETDAPDIPPHWLYVDAQERVAGALQGRNTPAELPAIAKVFSELRGLEMRQLAEQTRHNAEQALRMRISKFV